MTERERYEKELKRRQEQHLERVAANRKDAQESFWRPCAHDACEECHGTFVKLDGTRCVHLIACPCPKCNPVRCRAEMVPAGRETALRSSAA